MNRARKPTVTVGVRARFASTAAVVLALTACQGQQQEPDGVASPAPLVVHHDTEPLAQTFPALGTPVSASWITWSPTGSDGQPSRLKLEWLDAVVQVAPETMNLLLTEHESEKSTHRPAVQKVLEPDVPPGPFRTGVELNMAFGAELRSTRVVLDPPRNTVVLQSSLAG